MKVYGIFSKVVTSYNKGKVQQRGVPCKENFHYIPPLVSSTQDNFKIVRVYTNAQAINFGYKSILKTYWLKGKMPSVKFDMGGNLLLKTNITNGHMLAHSKGGKTSIENLMLETANYNFMKSDKPFSLFFNQEGFDAYCRQFEKIVLPNFNGKDYIEKISKTAKRLLKEGK